MKYCIYVMCATREDDVSPRWRYASKDINFIAGIVLTGTNRKEVGPVQTVREVFEITLTGCVGAFRGVNARGDAHNNNNPIKYS